MILSFATTNTSCPIWQIVDMEQTARQEPISVCAFTTCVLHQGIFLWLENLLHSVLLSSGDMGCASLQADMDFKIHFHPIR